MWQIPEVGYANEVTPGDRYANEQQGLSLSLGSDDVSGRNKQSQVASLSQ